MSNSMGKDALRMREITLSKAKVTQTMGSTQLEKQIRNQIGTLSSLVIFGGHCRRSWELI